MKFAPKAISEARRELYLRQGKASAVFSATVLIKRVVKKMETGFIADGVAQRAI
jgi:hypothetical protein